MAQPPRRPAPLRKIAEISAARTQARWRLTLAALALLGSSVLLWKFTPLAQLTSPAQLTAWLDMTKESALAPFFLLGCFVIGGLLIFPVTVLITVTAAVLEPALAVCVSMAGTLLSALVTYGIGARYVRGTAYAAGGPRMARLHALLQAKGIVAIAIARNIPVAPFSIFNIAAGAVGIGLRDYVIGTAIAFVPAISVLTLFGQQLRTLLARPTPQGVGLLLLILAGWIAVAFALQRIVSRRQQTH